MRSQSVLEGVASIKCRESYVPTTVIHAQPVSFTTPRLLLLLLLVFASVAVIVAAASDVVRRRRRRLAVSLSHHARTHTRTHDHRPTASPHQRVGTHGRIWGGGD